MNAWDFSIDDTSPLFTYHPFGEHAAIFSNIDTTAYVLVAGDGSSLSGGWMQWYSDYPGGFIQKPGDNQDGGSLHITSMPCANVSLSFHGAYAQPSSPAAHHHCLL